MIKYSIITVCLNSENTIERCLKSVKDQTYSDYEHIIIDGLSTDHTLNIIKSFGVDTCISEKDGGIYDAMNKGVSLAKGEYVLFLNSDDELHPHYLQECSQEDDADFISVGVDMIGDSRTISWKPSLQALKNVFHWRMPIPHPGLMVKRSLFHQLHGFDTHFRIAADYDFMIRMLKMTSDGRVIDKILVNFYDGGVSKSKKILLENNSVRKKNYTNIVFIKSAYLLDHLRWMLA